LRISRCVNVPKALKVERETKWVSRKIRDILNDNDISGRSFKGCSRGFVVPFLKSDGAIHNARFVIPLHRERISAAVLGSMSPSIHNDCTAPRAKSQCWDRTRSDERKEIAMLSFDKTILR
jgi:hypothetical protein